MSVSQPEPPRVSSSILAWAGRRLGVADLADDAGELFVEKVDQDGEGKARRWYRRQARAALWRVLLRGGGRPRDPRLANGFSTLDFKLGARMLAKHPGVTLVGGLALTIGIGLGAAYLEIVGDLLHPSIPLDKGDRIVGVQEWDAAAYSVESHTVHDFVTWRDEVTSIQELAAYYAVERNFDAGDAPSEPVTGAVITPSAFQLVRVPAFLGRGLIDADAKTGAPPAVVLGYSLWRSRFSGDPGIVGRSVRLDGGTSTVVGVMPEGFAFPVNHGFWLPLDVDALTLGYGPRQGPSLQVFGRLSPGATFGDAQTELTTLGLGAAANDPATYEHLRPRVVRYAELFLRPGDTGPEAYLFETIFVLVLLLLSSNVATMVFARTATRENEITVRFALGASRGRILTQLFVEALLLALAAAGVGLAVVAWGTEWTSGVVWQGVNGSVPFWVDDRLNGSTIVCALGFAVLSAVVAGVLPALKATGARMQPRLRQPAGGSGSSLRFGGGWTVVIVVQVAFAVIVIPAVVVTTRTLALAEAVDPGFPAGEYLSAQVSKEREHPPADAAARAEFFSEFEADRLELERRLEAVPEFSRVTFATRLPGMNHPMPGVEVEGVGDVPETVGQLVGTAAIDENFFNAFGATTVAGRGFALGDVSAQPGVVIVNEAFVQVVLKGRNALGRRIRYQTRYGEAAATGQPRGLEQSVALQPGPWYQIVGVVTNLGMDFLESSSEVRPGVYHPLEQDAMGWGGVYSVRVAFHVRGDPASFASDVRRIAESVDPTLRLHDVLPMDGPVDLASRVNVLVNRVLNSAIALATFVVLLISTAGTYALMSFTVARRTREIGIMSALGADRRRIVRDVFSRALLQIGGGVLVGGSISAYLLMFQLVPPGQPVWGALRLLFEAAAGLAMVGLVACGVPMARALRIEPTEALREVG